MKARVLVVLAGLCLTGCPGGSDPSGPGLGPGEVSVDGPTGFCGRDLSVPAELSVEFEVDCTGIDSVLSAGTTFGQSLVRVYGDIVPSDAESIARCAMVLREPLSEPLQDLVLNGQNAGDQGVAAITMVHRGSLWRSHDGCIKLDSYEPTTKTSPGRGSGEFEVVVVETPVNSMVGTGRYGIARGRVEWCEHSNRPDCGVAAASTGLVKAVEIDAPGGEVSFKPTDAFRNTTGMATECRMLIDQASGGLRVDMELGEFAGLPVLLYGKSCFGDGLQRAPMPNHFTFETAGVTGPGAYQTAERCGPGSDFKPWLQWDVPRSWEGRTSFQECLLGYLNAQSSVTPTELTTCELTVAESRFELSCNEVRWAPPPGSPGKVQFGPLTMAMDCDLEYR